MFRDNQVVMQPTMITLPSLPTLSSLSTFPSSLLLLSLASSALSKLSLFFLITGDLNRHFGAISASLRREGRASTQPMSSQPIDKLFVACSNKLRQSAVLRSHPNIPAIIELQQNRVGQRRRSAVVACGGNDENPLEKDKQLQQAENTLNRCMSGPSPHELPGRPPSRGQNSTCYKHCNKQNRAVYLTANTKSIGLCYEANLMGGNGCCTC